MSKNKSNATKKSNAKNSGKPSSPKAPRSIQGEGGTKVDPNVNPAADAPTAAQNAAKREKKSKANPKAAPKPRTRTKVSALEAAAQVLATSKVPMRATDLIAEMASRGLWKSPGGKTPESTLYAAIIREIATKGDAARFKKQERGMFVANTKNV